MIEYSSRNMRIWSRLGPSGAFGIAALELAETNKKSVMLTSDLCFFSGLERYKSEYPDRLINVGIAEQNMIGIAAGFAKEGFIPFANTYASFCASRCADQVRVNMSYMKLPIKLIGLTSGFAAGILGATHMSIEDVAFMRALPNITVISPADCTEIIKCCLAASRTKDPTYIRLTGPMNMPIVYKEDYNYEIGKAIQLQQGEDICIIASGSSVYYSLQAANLLAQTGISCSVINMHTIKPLDVTALNAAAAKHKLIVTVEEHSVYGGLGGSVAEHLAQSTCRTPLMILGIQDAFPTAGNYQYLIEKTSLSAEKIKEQIFNRYTALFG